MLTRIPTHQILDHIRHNSTAHLPTNLLEHPWYYLSNFYTPPTAPPGYATQHLRMALQHISRNKPIILCCEPILGTDPRSITPKTAEMTPDERYTGLQNYYKTRFGLHNSLPTRTTLKTELTGHGKRWSDCERHLMYGLINPILQ